MSDHESLFRLLGKLENVQYLKGIKQIYNHELIEKIIACLPKLRDCEEYFYMGRAKIAGLCPEYEIVDISGILWMTDEEIENLNVKRFKIGLVGECTGHKDRFSQVFKKFHYLEEIRMESMYSPFVLWSLIKEEREFRIEYNKKLSMTEKQDNGGDYYPETIHIKINDEVNIDPEFQFNSHFPLSVETSRKEQLQELAPYCEKIDYYGSIKDLLLLLKNEGNIKQLKELDLSKNNHNWITPRNTIQSTVIVGDEKLSNLTMELFRKVIVQLMNRLKSLQIVKLSLPFTILVLFGKDLKPNMSHYNLEKHAILDWIPLNYYASVENYGETIPKLILKKRTSSPQYKEPTEYETIDFSILNPPKVQVKPIGDISNDYQPTGFGLLDDVW
ncbi:predicted protein [Naegleria gruberi]|uniref:Predicted protein n=1 Tax=Naegleria gruberi TaxID=5762 RepID=D2VRN5_NAEGR|nr:uncharacterized protein NAEGRDRAFT_71648 [Naegleria gruberi]EFC40424.1 predicted protein [Naegleria gruberi]|eukprot:XP_002673168.1 predicted protein [Naegleria gruberi strain NEG-M]